MRAIARQWKEDEEGRNSMGMGGNRNNRPYMPGQRGYAGPTDKDGNPMTQQEIFERRLRKTHPHISPLHFKYPVPRGARSAGPFAAPSALISPNYYHNLHGALASPASGMQFRV